MARCRLISPQGPKNGGVQLGQSYDGIDFLGSNCFCLPPDTNAAVGNNFVVETVNVQIRVFDKTSGEVLLDEPSAHYSGRQQWDRLRGPLCCTSRAVSARSPWKATDSN
jgi:hypothetical protein